MKTTKIVQGIKILTGCLLFLLVLSPNVHAIGGGGSQKPSPANGQTDPDYRAGKKAAKAKDWPTAIRYLEKAVKNNSQNADAWNYLGFSYRKSGNLAKAFPAYEQALKIDPKHRGAYEYLGEAYLQAGNLPQAQLQMDQLIKICGRNCEESKDLQKAINAYKAGK
jgi:tetratricopeptide (TPR) repeat protein